MELTYTIIRTAVMTKVEGLTVMLSQHNPGVPFETLWASAGDQPKMDLYYKEAISDLEDSLKRWIKTSSSQFDILAVGEDYTITFILPPDALALTKLKGLLANRLQDYFAHAILSNWVADLPDGTPIHPDYTTITAGDLGSIQELLMERDYLREQSARADNDDDENDESFMLSQGERIEDDDVVHVRNDRTNWSNWSDGPEPVFGSDIE